MGRMRTISSSLLLSLILFICLTKRCSTSSQSCSLHEYRAHIHEMMTRQSESTIEATCKYRYPKHLALSSNVTLTGSQQSCSELRFFTPFEAMNLLSDTVIYAFGYMNTLQGIRYYIDQNEDDFICFNQTDEKDALISEQCRWKAQHNQQSHQIHLHYNRSSSIIDTIHLLSAFVDNRYSSHDSLQDHQLDVLIIENPIQTQYFTSDVRTTLENFYESADEFTNNIEALNASKIALIVDKWNPFGHKPIHSTLETANSLFESYTLQAGISVGLIDSTPWMTDIGNQIARICAKDIVPNSESKANFVNNYLQMLHTQIILNYINFYKANHQGKGRWPKVREVNDNDMHYNWSSVIEKFKIYKEEEEEEENDTEEHSSLKHLTSKLAKKSFVILSAASEGMSKWLHIIADIIDTVKRQENLVLVEPCFNNGTIRPCWSNEVIPISFVLDLNKAANRSTGSGFEWITWSDFSRLMERNLSSYSSIVCNIIGERHSEEIGKQISHAFHVDKIMSFHKYDQCLIKGSNLAKEDGHNKLLHIPAATKSRYVCMFVCVCMFYHIYIPFYSFRYCYDYKYGHSVSILHISS